MSAARILVVDDQEPIVTLLCATLSQCGFEAVGATDVERAFEIVETGPTVDLVVSDMEMPLMQGPELLDAVQAVSLSTALILMSGARSIVVRPQIAFFQKPFTTPEFLAAVEASLAVSRGALPVAVRREPND